MQRPPEQCGQRILQVCRDNCLRPGAQLSPQLLRQTLLDTDTLESEELIAGLQWLIDNGCLEEHGPIRSGYRLTQKGALLMTRE